MVHTTMKNYVPYLLLIVFCIPLFFLNVPNAHSLGDDFAQYIKEADNIARGRPYYESNYVFNNLDQSYAPPQYPPGYPLLLAPVVRVYGIAIRPMLYMNSLLVAALLFALFAYFRKYAGVVASVCLSLVLVYSDVILDAKGQVLSDTSCMLFVVLYLLVRNQESFSVRRTLLLICLATMVILIRSQGLIILVAEGLYFLVAVFRLIRSRRFSISNVLNLVSLKLVAGTAVLFLIMNKIVFHSPHATFSFYMSMTSTTADAMWSRVGDNADYLMTLFTGFLHFRTINQFWQFFATVFEYGAFVFAAVGFIMSLWKKIRVDDLFFILMCLMILYLPVHQGPRFLFEAFPMYLLYGYVAASKIAARVGKLPSAGIAVAITAIYLLLGFRTFKRDSQSICDGCVPSPVTMEFFDYIKTHVNDSGIIVFPRPRLLTLYTGKKAIVYASRASDEENKKKFDELRVKYFMPWFDDNLRRYMRSKEVVIDSQVLGDATLYRVR